MMNRNILLMIFLTSLSIGCKKTENYQGPSANFGTAEYYKPFLFSKSDTLILSKSLKYNFNDYAVEQNSNVKIKLVDTAQNKISNNNIRLFINGEFVKSNEFNINSEDSENGVVQIGIQLLPDYPEGYTSGFLSISNHSLDVINNNDLKTSSENRLFKWEAHHKIVMNPLKKTLMWIGFFIIAFLLIWFLFLRNMLYPKFKKGKLQILKPYFGGVSFNGNTKQIVFTDTCQKQKMLNKMFTGVVKYEVNPVYKQNIILRPGRQNKIKIKLPMGAQITPSVINMEKYNSYTIKFNGEVIEIQYS